MTRRFLERLALLTLGLGTALGCTTQAPPKAASHKPLPAPTGVLFCGIERTNALGQGYDQAGRDCLWEAWRLKKPAELTIVLDGDERAQSEFHVRTTQDRWVRVGVSHFRLGEVRSIDYECRDLQREEVPGMTHRAGFVAKSCEGGFNRVIRIP